MKDRRSSENAQSGSIVNLVGEMAALAALQGITTRAPSDAALNVTRSILANSQRPSTAA